MPEHEQDAGQELVDQMNAAAAAAQKSTEPDQTQAPDADAPEEAAPEAAAPEKPAPEPETEEQAHQRKLAELEETALEFVKAKGHEMTLAADAADVRRLLAIATKEVERVANIAIKRAELTAKEPSRDVLLEIEGMQVSVSIARSGVQVKPA